jgi:hypothetical protein
MCHGEQVMKETPNTSSYFTDIFRRRDVGIKLHAQKGGDDNDAARIPQISHDTVRHTRNHSYAASTSGRLYH